MKNTLLFTALLFICLAFSNQPSYSQDVDLYLNNLNVYVSDYGRVALYSLPDTIRQVWRTSLLVGTGIDDVFDLIQDAEIEDSTRLLGVPSYGDFEIYGSYDNDYSSEPPNVLEKENVYCWQDMTSIIIKYTIINRESNPINAIVGLEFIPIIDNNGVGGDSVLYSSQSKVTTVKNIRSVGLKSLSADFKSLNTFYYFEDYGKDTLFYTSLNYNSFDSLFITDPADTNVDAPVIIPAYNSQTIAAGDSVIYYVALAYGATAEAMLASMQQAQEKYDLMTTSVEHGFGANPFKFALSQNYPNPFNPGTKISFNLPQKDYVSLNVFSVLGERIGELVNSEMAAGQHTLEFNADNLSGGVYFYTLTAGNYSETKKMILLK
ncbi:MAG TPA: T9SS type A sorting domain-containing protein [Ignavibacteriaceae bacterium]|nr:T9SS type A sorting domain-containing protein [Ignavibacteriaceae bacterium]